ncbi:hypothetical protein ZIOFF_042293 [Zingiber officinale]|uniref:Uncharacterized protein n=1 Tax=Zingiber officinale TaxID=94328 RepID=A0A8J5G8W8_ZINOF|nr:hypothetical protein ZIOFF_042293 [Zingiber officinale]
MAARPFDSASLEPFHSNDHVRIAESKSSIAGEPPWLLRWKWPSGLPHDFLLTNFVADLKMGKNKEMETGWLCRPSQDECRCPTNSIRDISTLPYKYLNKLSQMHMDESQTTTSFKTPVLATSTSLSLWSNHEMKHHLSGSPSYLWMYFLRVDLQEGDIWKDEYYFFCDNNRSNNNDGAQAVMIHEDDFVSAMQSLQLKPLCITMLISLATSIQHSYLKTEALEVGPDSLP